MTDYATAGLTETQLDQLLWDLGRLPEMYSWLDGMTSPDKKPRDPDARRSIPGSRIDLDLTVLDLTDTRAKANLRVDMHYPWPDQTAVNPDRMGVLPTLHNWATYIVGDIRDHGGQAELPLGIPTVDTLSRHIANHANWIREADWAPTLCAHIAHITDQLARYAPNRQPQPDKRRDLTLWPMPEVSELMCTHDAADWLRVSPRAIRGWRHRGLLDWARDDNGQAIRDDKGRRLHRREALLACAGGQATRAEYTLRELAAKIPTIPEWTIRGWAKRGQLDPVGKQGNARTYRLTDAQALAALNTRDESKRARAQ